MTSSDRSSAPVFSQAFTRAFARNPNSHWLHIAGMLADVAFETDALGRFAMFGQSSVLGIPSARLLGRNISELCRLTGNSASASSSFGSIFTALSREKRVWRGLVSLARGDGRTGNYQIFLAPKPPAAGGKPRRAGTTEAAIAGAYGLLIDIDAPEFQMAAPAAARAIGMLDPQTGLWSAPRFAQETGRRFDRLDVEGLPGTLLLLGFSRTSAIGHNAVAAALAQELLDVSRPTDILGRINSTTFAVWCDGMDNLTGAERAARFCQRLPVELPGNPCISVGLVARWPGNMEDSQMLIDQAMTALQHADRVAQEAADVGSADPVAKGTWRVWNPQRSQ